MRTLLGEVIDALDSFCPEAPMTPTNPIILSHQFLDETYQDAYFPDVLAPREW
ncbi:MAG: hypothetical protein ACI8RZ_003861 [Myxococcota bacterium]|jgi:hypothetical protein